MYISLEKCSSGQNMEHFLFFIIYNLTPGLGELLAVCFWREWPFYVCNEKSACSYCNRWGAYL
jgi:hypothetical protein